LITLKIKEISKIDNHDFGVYDIDFIPNTMKGNRWTQLIFFTNKTGSDCSSKKIGKVMDIGFEY